MQKKKSRAWYEGVCVCRRGELQFAHTTICPYCKIHPCCKFVHIVNSSMLQIHPCGRANCNSPLHVRYPNVGKYYMQIASRAWYEGVCVCRRGELQFAHTTICPYCKIHPCCKFAHTPIRPHCISPILRIHPCGRANCSHTQLRQLADFAPTRVFSGCWRIYM